jgi:hypothetical protein
MSTVDPAEVRMTGENSFVRLGEREEAPLTTRASHWRVLLSPAGPGHALYLQSELTDGQVAIYSDNVALARWLQEEIEVMLHPPFADTALQVVEAAFTREGDARSFITERILSRGQEIALTWYSFLEPFVIDVPAGVTGRPLGVYSTFIPAQRASVVVDGVAASGRPLSAPRDGRPCTTACLAWSETWVRPREAPAG